MFVSVCMFVQVFKHSFSAKYTIYNRHSPDLNSYVYIFTDLLQLLANKWCPAYVVLVRGSSNGNGNYITLHYMRGVRVR